MSIVETLLHPYHAGGEAPSGGSLLFVFMLPMLAIVAMVVLIGVGLTWALVAATVAAIALMTAIVMVAIGRLLDDDGDD